MAKKLIKPGVKLKRYEAEIESGIGTVGRALSAIQNQRLYKETHDTFESYCKERWGFGRDYAYKLIKTEEFVNRVSTMVDKVPTVERHIREVLKAPEKKQAAIVAEVLEKCEQEKREPTAKDYRAAAKPFIEPKPKSTPAIAVTVTSVEFNVGQAQIEINKLLKQLNNAGETEALESIRDVLLLLVPLAKGIVSPRKSSATFEAFWNAYPPTNRRSRGTAEKAWKVAIKKVSAETIISAAAEYARSPQGQSEYCPGPTPWLNQERWADEREAWNRGGDNGEVAVGIRSMQLGKL